MPAGRKFSNGRLDNCIEFCNKIIAVCNDLKSGSSTKDACKNHDISINDLRMVIARMDNKNSSKKKYFLPSSYLMTSKERFLADLFEYKDEIFHVPNDFDKIFDNVLSQLNKNEQIAVKLHYFEDSSLSEIGNEIGVSKERVRQILNKALRKLRHPARISLFLDGYKSDFNIKDLEYIKISDSDLISKVVEMSDRFNRIEESDLRKKLVSDKYLKGKNLSSKLIDRFIDLGFSSTLDIILNIDKIESLDLSSEEISSLNLIKDDIYNNIYKDNEILNCINLGLISDLSNRSYNALHRYGINTLGDLIKLDEKSVKKIRNLGDESFKEIIKVLDRYGLKLSDSN